MRSPLRSDANRARGAGLDRRPRAERRRQHRRRPPWRRPGTQRGTPPPRGRGDVRREGGGPRSLRALPLRHGPRARRAARARARAAARVAAGLVLREACGRAAQWRQEGLLPERFVMWVNISGRQLVGGGLSRTVETVLQDSGLPAECLGLEVTETTLVEEGAGGARARAELQQLHEAG